MLKTLTLSAMLALGTTGAAFAAGEGHVEDFDFSFEGPFGSYDTNQLQRGLQVYTEICSACHGLEYVAFRNLAEEGGPALPEDQMRAYAAQFQLNDYDSNPRLVDPATGDQRVFTPADRFPANHMVGAPDLSLMAKARAGFHGPYGTGLSQFFNGMGGAEYIASILSGYADEPECALEGEPMDGYYNTAFANGGFPESCVDEDGHHMVPGSYIGMAQPLYGDDVEFADGHSTEIDHIAQDVAAFLMWAAEPKLVARKQAGLTGVLFLAILSVLLYLTNKRIWAPHKGKAHHV